MDDIELAKALRRSVKLAESLHKRATAVGDDTSGEQRQTERQLDKLLDDYTFMQIERDKLAKEIKELKSEKHKLSAELREVKQVKSAIECLASFGKKDAT